MGWCRPRGRRRPAVGSRLVSIERLWWLFLDQGRSDRLACVAIGSCRVLWLGRLDFWFDKGPPGPIGRGLVVDHAELLPPSSECHRRLPGSPPGSIERRPSETLPGLGGLAQPRAPG